MLLTFLAVPALVICGALATERKAGVTLVGRCEELKVEECTQIGYRSISTHNFFNQTQFEANREFQSFLPLIRSKCSDRLLPFLCLAFFSPCFEKPYPLPPCRNQCVNLERPCSNDIRRLGLDWPNKFDCNKYPIQGIGKRPCCTSTLYRWPRPPH